MNPKPDKKLSLGAESHVTLLLGRAFSPSPKFFCPPLWVYKEEVDGKHKDDPLTKQNRGVMYRQIITLLFYACTLLKCMELYCYWLRSIACYIRVFREGSGSSVCSFGSENEGCVE